MEQLPILAFRLPTLLKTVNIVSVVGEDFPESYIKMLENHGVNTKGLQIKKGEKTFFLEWQIS